MTTTIVETLRSTQTMSILLAAVACALADIFLKKAALHGNLVDALRSPWLLMAVVLYLLQVYFFILAFIAGSKLSIMGTLLTALYAVIVLVAGILFYNESLTRLQSMGILLAVSGIVLINWS